MDEWLIGAQNKVHKKNQAVSNYLYGDLGVEDFLTEGAVVQDERVHVQQVFLEVVHGGELLVAALAHVLRRRGGVMHCEVLEQCLLCLKVFLVALRAGLASQQHLQVRLQMSLETFEASESEVALIARIIPVASHGGCGIASQSVAFGR